MDPFLRQEITVDVQFRDCGAHDAYFDVTITGPDDALREFNDAWHVYDGYDLSKPGDRAVADSELLKDDE